MDFQAVVDACEEGDLERVEQALPFLDLRRTDDEGDTLLVTAVLANKIALVQRLIPGSDLTQRDAQGRTPLIVAVAFHRQAMIGLLMPGSDLRQRDRKGRTALMHAVLENQPAMVAALLPGSDATQRDNLGRTAWRFALKHQHWACLDHLAAHDPKQDRLAWPKRATPQDLPRWYARRERTILDRTVEDPAIDARERRRL